MVIEEVLEGAEDFVAVRVALAAASGLGGELAEVQADVVGAVHFGFEDQLGELLGGRDLRGACPRMDRSESSEIDRAFGNPR